VELHPLALDVLAPLLPRLDRDVVPTVPEAPPERDRWKCMPWIAESADQDAQCRRRG
jgi:hypothetical protein